MVEHREQSLEQDDESVQSQRSTVVLLEEDEKIIRNKIEKIKTLQIGDSPKAELILILLGLKPATEIGVYTWNAPVLQLLQVLSEIGLYASEKENRKNENPHKTCAVVVSKDRGFAQRLMAIDADKDHYEYGLLMGFPHTAVEGFVKNDLLPQSEYPLDNNLFRTILSATGETVIVGNSLFHFSLSRGHWQEEIRVLEEWQKALEKYAPEMIPT